MLIKRFLLIQFLAATPNTIEILDNDDYSPYNYTTTNLNSEENCSSSYNSYENLDYTFESFYPSETNFAAQKDQSENYNEFIAKKTSEKTTIDEKTECISEMDISYSDATEFLQDYIEKILNGNSTDYSETQNFEGKQLTDIFLPIVENYAIQTEVNAHNKEDSSNSRIKSRLKMKEQVVKSLRLKNAAKLKKCIEQREKLKICPIYKATRRFLEEIVNF